MINSKDNLSVKLKFAIIFFAFLSVFFLSSVFSNTITAYAYTLEDYEIVSAELKAIEYYPYQESEQSLVNQKMQEYLLIKQDVSAEEYDSIAEQKYSTLTSQRENFDDYYTSSNAILCIICYADNPSLATNAMTAYASSKQNLIASYGATKIMLYVNSNSADSKYALLLSEKSTYIEYPYNPQPARVSYVYDGSEKSFILNGFDSRIMTVSNNKQTNANEEGYDVVVSLKDKINYRWRDGTVNDLHYEFKIQKAVLSENEINNISFESGTYFYTNTAHSVQISNIPEHMSVDCLFVNDERVVGNGFSATNCGTYAIVAHLITDDNYVFVENNRRLSEMQLTATLEIKPQELVSNSVIIQNESGFNTNLSLYVQKASSFENGIINDLLIKKNVIRENEQVVSMYQAYFVQNGEEVEPTSAVTIRMLIPESVRGIDFRLVHIHNVSENVDIISNVSFTTSGNYVVFETDSLSSFAFITQNQNYGSNTWSIVAIFSVVTLFISLTILIVLYLLWKNYGRKKVKCFVPFFKKLNKLFHGTELNDVELVEEGKKLLRKANESQKIHVEKMIIEEQNKKEVEEIKLKSKLLKNKNSLKFDKNTKNKK